MRQYGGAKRESSVLVFYDIEKNKTRRHVVEVLKDYGLHPVQYSVCLGRLSANRCEEMFLKARKVMEDGGGYLIVVPVCETDFRKVRHTGKPLGMSQVSLIHFA